MMVHEEAPLQPEAQDKVNTAPCCIWVYSLPWCWPSMTEPRWPPVTMVSNCCAFARRKIIHFWYFTSVFEFVIIVAVCLQSYLKLIPGYLYTRFIYISIHIYAYMCGKCIVRSLYSYVSRRLPVKHDVEAVEFVAVFVRDHDGLHALDGPAWACTWELTRYASRLIGKISLLANWYRMMSLFTSAHARLLAWAGETRSKAALKQCQII